jgi:CheY-like chemotaxis protein
MSGPSAGIVPFAQEASAGQGAARTLLTGRILVVEDGLDNQILIERFLTKAGATVRVANNGREALVRIAAAIEEHNPFDLIVTDMQMPEMDGYAMARALRSQSYAQPILALTAHALSGDREKCIDAGCDDYMTKPINRPQLIARCLYWMEVRGVHQLSAVAA